MKAAPERGDLVHVQFHSQAETRPGIVLSPQQFNHVTGFAVVCPITEKQKGYPFEVVLPDGLVFEGVILTDQVKSLDWFARQVESKGSVPDSIVRQCLDKIHTFL